MRNISACFVVQKGKRKRNHGERKRVQDGIFDNVKNRNNSNVRRICVKVKH